MENRLNSQKDVHPKVLFCTSYTRGNLWLERMARQQGQLYNVTVKTLESFVLETAKLRLAEEGLSYLSGTAPIWVVHTLLTNLAAGGNPLLAHRNRTPGLVKAFQTALFDLRKAGLTSEELSESAFGNPDKGRLVKRLLADYEQYLQNNQLADYASAVCFAMAELTDMAGSSTSVYLIPASLWRQQDALTTRLLDALALRGQLVILDDGQLGRLGPVSAEFFAATGSLAEAREVFRRILKSNTPLDHVEIVTSDPAETMAVYTVAQNLGIPIRFAQGLPAAVSALGQLANVFVDWVSSNYDVSLLLDAMRSGILRVPDHRFTRWRVIQALTEANVGWGRNRYLHVLGTAAERFREEKPELAMALDGLQMVFTELFKFLPGDKPSLNEAAAAMDEFLSRFGHVASEVDAQVQRGVRDLRESLTAFPSLQIEPDVVVQYLRDLLSSLSVGQSSRPEPGAIFVTNLANGALSGRPSTYVMGVSESKWAMSTLQDPILLDEERRRIHERLFTTAHRVHEMEMARRQFFQSLTGRATLSYSAVQVQDGKVEGPAPEMLEFYRQQTGYESMDYSSFVESLGEPVGYAGTASKFEQRSLCTPKQGVLSTSERGLLDTTDAWLQSLLMPNGLFRAGLDGLLQEHPALQQGIRAEQLRDESPMFTEFDGVVDTGLGLIEPSYFSPTALETLAKCPRQFFFKQILKLSLPEETKFDRSRWLDALQRGSLYHEIYHDYMQWVADGNEHSEEKLLAFCEQVLARYAEEIPSPSPHVQAMEAGEIRQAMKKFYALEQKRQGVTQYLEQEIGHWQAPFPVELGQGVTLPLFGKVDRLDRIGEHEYRIYDYKTGSDYGFSANAYFQAGQRLQHALYAVAVEQWLEKTGQDHCPQVVESSYVFTTDKARQDEITYRQNRRVDLRNLVVSLRRILEQGVFISTQDVGNCTFCDFVSICTGKAASQSKAKRQEAANETVSAILGEVSRYA